MSKGPLVWIASLLIAAIGALAPATAAAQRIHGASSGSRAFVGSPAGARASAHHHFASDPFARRAFFHRPFSVVVYAPYAYAPPSYYEPPSYYDPSPVYAPPAAYAPGGTVSVAPVPPMPTVVEYPTGRYELRGDGITAPYRWVWIPNPPSAPPAPPAGAPPALAPPASRDPEPARQTTLYRWTDEQGVLHLTDRRSSVPERYRQ